MQKTIYVLLHHAWIKTYFLNHVWKLLDLRLIVSRNYRLYSYFYDFSEY